MSKYKKKISKKPYEKSQSIVHNTKKKVVLPKTSELNVEVIQSALQVESSSCSQRQCSDGDLLQCECCNLWHCSKYCQISDEAIAIIEEVDSIHWFCQPCKIEVFNLKP